MECPTDAKVVVGQVARAKMVRKFANQGHPHGHPIIITINIFIFCIGLILNLSPGVDCSVVQRNGGDGRSNQDKQGQDIKGVPENNALLADSNHIHGNIDDGLAVDRDKLQNEDVHIATGSERARGNNNVKTDKVETEKLTDETNYDGHPPILLLPNIAKKVDNNQTNYQTVVDRQRHGILVQMQYEPNHVIRCGAVGNPRPNVSWQLDDGHLPSYVATTALTFSGDDAHTSMDNNFSPDELHSIMDYWYNYGDEGNDVITASEEEDDGYDLKPKEPPVSQVAWVDLKLPLLNNAFYGRLRCVAENSAGNATWTLELVHNANSSVFMKLVRSTFACVLLLVGVLLFKGFLWVDNKRKEKLYEKLPAQDLEIIKKFQKGLPPPLPSPSSSIMVTGSAMSSCMPGVEITVTDSDTCNPVTKGYRPVKHQSSSPDLQKRFGASTPSSCGSVHVLDSVNGWTNYVPYDDKLETSSQHFNVDFSQTIENGRYGMLFAGKVRNDLTMNWSSVAVKTGKTERDDNFILESILTELKLLASLPKPHEHLVNLKGAYTKLLHKRQAYVFVDYCANGNLANFIDLNRNQFIDLLCSHSSDSTHTTPAAGPSTAGIPTASFTVNTSDSFEEDKHVTISVEQPQKKSFSMKELLCWARQIADGMNFLHKNRIVHGNLDSENIYLTPKLSAKIGNIGYPPAALMECVDPTTKKWLTIPHFGDDQFSKRSDIWDYGRVLWEIFSLRLQQCPDSNIVREFIRNEQTRDTDGIEIPDFATPEMFDILLCCWNEDSTLCPEFDFFVKIFRQLYREMFSPRASSSSNLDSTAPSTSSSTMKSQLSKEDKDGLFHV